MISKLVSETQISKGLRSGLYQKNPPVHVRAFVAAKPGDAFIIFGGPEIGGVWGAMGAGTDKEEFFWIDPAVLKASSDPYFYVGYSPAPGGQEKPKRIIRLYYAADIIDDILSSDTSMVEAVVDTVSGSNGEMALTSVTFTMVQGTESAVVKATPVKTLPGCAGKEELTRMKHEINKVFIELYKKCFVANETMTFAPKRTHIFKMDAAAAGAAQPSKRGRKRAAPGDDEEAAATTTRAPATTDHTDDLGKLVDDALKAQHDDLKKIVNDALNQDDLKKIVDDALRKGHQNMADFMENRLTLIEERHRKLRRGVMKWMQTVTDLASSVADLASSSDDEIQDEEA